MAITNYFEVLKALQGLPQTGGMPQMQPTTFDPSTMIQLQTPGVDLGAVAPPQAPSAPIDRSIIDQYLALAGPVPTAPTPQRVSTLDKIAAALQGVQAGFQGRGGEFAAGLREQRERPQREFEAKQERYDARRTQLGLEGTRAAQDAESRRQARVTAEADRQFDLDVKRRAQQLGFENEVSIAKLREGMELEREAKRQAFESDKQDKAIKAQRERDARAFEEELVSKDGVSPKLAKEIAEYTAGIRTELSPAAEKARTLRAQKLQAQLGRITGGGGGGQSSGGGGDVPSGQVIVLSDGRMIDYYKGIQDDIAKGAFGRDAEGKPNVFIQEIRRGAPSAVEINDSSVQQTIQNAQKQGHHREMDPGL
jgi:hypothetical protein